MEVSRGGKFETGWRKNVNLVSRGGDPQNLKK